MDFDLNVCWLLVGVGLLNYGRWLGCVVNVFFGDEMIDFVVRIGNSICVMYLYLYWIEMEWICGVIDCDVLFVVLC